MRLSALGNVGMLDSDDFLHITCIFFLIFLRVFLYFLEIVNFKSEIFYWKHAKKCPGCKKELIVTAGQELRVIYLIQHQHIDIETFLLYKHADQYLVIRS